jgi:hypothetical protein
MLKQAQVFRENEKVQERVMDSNDQERERGITILAKNAAIDYNGKQLSGLRTSFTGPPEGRYSWGVGSIVRDPPRIPVRPAQSAGESAVRPWALHASQAFCTWGLISDRIGW